MSKLILQEYNSFITRVYDLNTINGQVTIEIEHDSVEFDIEIKSVNSNISQDNQHIFLKMNAETLLDTVQTINRNNFNDPLNITLQWEKYKNYGYIELFNKMKTAVETNRGLNNRIINYDTVTKFGNSAPGGEKYYGGVLLPDGKVLCIPTNASYFSLIDPITMTQSNYGPSISGSWKYHTGIVLPNNKILIFPNSKPRFLLIDYENNNFQEIGPNFGEYNGYTSGTLLPDGRVICCPSGATNKIIIFDWLAETIEEIDWFNNTIPSTSEAKYMSTILVDNNLAIATPYYESRPLLINVHTKIATPFGTAISGEQKYHNSSLTADKKICCMPWKAGHIAMIDPETLTITPVYTTAARMYEGSCLLPDGRVLGAPQDTPYIGAYDPYLNTLASIGPADQVYLQYSGAVLLPDKRVLLIQDNAEYPALVSASDGDYGTEIENDVFLSCYFNKL